MFDREFVIEILEQILEASQRVLKRFEPIRSVDSFCFFLSLCSLCLCVRIFFNLFRSA
jgi:hypothetical protein